MTGGQRNVEPPCRWYVLVRDLAGLLIAAALLTVVVSPSTPAALAGKTLQGASHHPLGLQPRAGPRQVRPPAVAGQFYPGQADELYALVDSLLAAGPAVGLRHTRAVLVPHAGYPYSAPVAAASFREVDGDFRRVFILAANHNGEADFAGVSLPAVTHYAIPGAEVPVAAVVDSLRRHPLFTNVPAAHTMHMIEVELPFLHQLRGRPPRADFEIVPMILGRMDTDQIQRLVALLDAYADERTLFVFSVDLSHYYPDSEARQLDAYTLQAVMSRDPAAVARATTDGDQVLLTLVGLARRRGWEPSLLMYRNSGDATGDGSRVVGYGAIAFAEPLRLTSVEQRALLAYARRTVAAAVGRGAAPAADSLLLGHPVFRIPRGVFVTLEEDGRLRGCIGHLVARGPLYDGVRSCAVDAALHDSRFAPVTAAELDDLSVSISVLDFPARVRVDEPAQLAQVLKPFEDGVILVHGDRRSTYLPSVWASIPEPRAFLSRLCLKQGSPADCWRDTATTAYRYSAYEIAEPAAAAGRGDGGAP